MRVLGLKYIHLLTASKDAILRIDLKAYEAIDRKNDTAFAIFRKFWIGDENSTYTLEEISDYTGKRINQSIPRSCHLTSTFIVLLSIYLILCAWW